MNIEYSHPLLPSFIAKEFDFQEKQDLMITWHSHEEIELIYVKTGQVYITIEDTTLSASQGDYLFINQNIHHFYTPSDRCLVIYCINFPPSMLVGLARLDLEREYILPVIHQKKLEYLYLSSTHPQYSEFGEYFQKLYQAGSAKDTRNDLCILSICLQIWHILYCLCLTPAGEVHLRGNALDEQRVKEAILFIQEHYMESITLDDIADSIMVSKSECCRCFKRVMQSTPFEYLLEYRIMEATKRMKRKKQESISQIAGSVGFNNTSYFNKIFKKIMNCTPSEYKQQILG